MRIAVVLVLAAFGLASCGGGDPTGAASAALEKMELAVRQGLADVPARAVSRAASTGQTVTAAVFMDWAQTHNASDFPGAQPLVGRDGFVFRYYPGSGNFIIVMATGDIYYLGPLTGGKLSRAGALSDFTCSIFPSSCASSIAGSWVVAGSVGSMITFLDTGDYVQAQWAFTEANPVASQVWAGLEHGTYTWNSATGALTFTCPDVDTNGTAGFSDGYTGGFTAFKGDPIGTCKGAGSGRSATISNNNTLTFVTPGGSITGSRVVDAGNPIVGTWRLAANPGSTLTFFGNGEFVMSAWVVTEANPVASQVWPGVEHATYTWNANTGAVTFTCPNVDTNGTTGISGNYSGGFTAYKGDPLGNCLGARAGTVTVNGNTLTLLSPGGTFVFSRVM